MNRNPQLFSERDKLVLAGLFLSKFDVEGLTRLGFETFAEAFNVLGFALGGRPARIKNYRDEFDPLFPNPRKGWHHRPRRNYCMRLFDHFGSLEIDAFTALVQSLIGLNPKLLPQEKAKGKDGYVPSTLTSRLATGVAAENYFRFMQPQLPEFSDYTVEDTTLLGCGYDFCLHHQHRKDFLAVEVKGLKEQRGNVTLTEREHHVAKSLNDRFLLFVVKNFKEKPFHEIYRAPLGGPLKFKRKETIVVQVGWLSSI